MGPKRLEVRSSQIGRPLGSVTIHRSYRYTRYQWKAGTRHCCGASAYLYMVNFEFDAPQPEPLGLKMRYISILNYRPLDRRKNFCLVPSAFSTDKDIYLSDHEPVSFTYCIIRSLFRRNSFSSTSDSLNVHKRLALISNIQGPSGFRVRKNQSFSYFVLSALIAE